MICIRTSKSLMTILPSFNLGDWHDFQHQPFIPYLSHWQKILFSHEVCNSSTVQPTHVYWKTGIEILQKLIHSLFSNRETQRQTEMLSSTDTTVPITSLKTFIMLLMYTLLKVVLYYWDFMLALAGVLSCCHDHSKLSLTFMTKMVHCTRTSSQWQGLPIPISYVGFWSFLLSMTISVEHNLE